MEIYAGQSGAVECVPSFNASNRYDKHPAGIRSCERDHTTKCAERFRHPITYFTFGTEGVAFLFLLTGWVSLFGAFPLQHNLSISKQLAHLTLPPIHNLHPTLIDVIRTGQLLRNGSTCHIFRHLSTKDMDVASFRTHPNARVASYFSFSFWTIASYVYIYLPHGISIYPRVNTFYIPGIYSPITYAFLEFLQNYLPPTPTSRLSFFCVSYDHILSPSVTFHASSRCGGTYNIHFWRACHLRILIYLLG